MNGADRSSIFSGLYLREVEDIVHERGQQGGAAVDGVGEVTLLLVEDGLLEGE